MMTREEWIAAGGDPKEYIEHTLSPRPGLHGQVTWPPGTHTIQVVMDPHVDEAHVLADLVDLLGDVRGIIVEKPVRHG